MIDAASVPMIEGDMDALAAHARDVDATGAAVADIGARVHTTWQGLRPVYSAPEAEQLLAATLPVQSTSASAGEDIAAAAAALLRYCDDVRDIQVRLKALQGRAAEFEADVRLVDDPGAEQAYVDQNNELVSSVDAAMADFDEAQRRCANAINALYRGGITYRADNEDGVAEIGEFGATAAQYDAAATGPEGLPWGRVEPDAPPPDPNERARSLHTLLDLAGLIPVVGEVFDGVNAAWYGAEGDYLDAGLSAAAMVPLAGWAATGGKLGIKTVHTVDGARAFVKGRPSRVPWDAKEVPFTSPGHLGAGQRYEWKVRTTGVDAVTGDAVQMEKTVRYHAHGPDPTRPPTDNAGAGPTYRVRVGNHYLDAEGNRYTANSVKPSSPAFDPKAANDTHIPFPTDQPPPHVPQVRVVVPNPAGLLGPDGTEG